MRNRLVVGLLYAMIIVIAVSCSSGPEPELRAIDREKMELVLLTGESMLPVDVYDADFVVLGGGLGGIAAVLSICNTGRTVILVEESDRIAGCFAESDTTLYTESRYVEASGSSRTYQEFRRAIREWYDQQSEQPPALISDLYDALDDFTDDSFCFDTRAALDAIDHILSESVERGRLTILKRHKVAGVMAYNDRISSVQTIDLDSHVCDQVRGWMYIDATRTGDFFTVAQVANLIGPGDGSAVADSSRFLTTYYGANPVDEPSVMVRDGVYVSALTKNPPATPDTRYTVQIPRRARRIKSLRMMSEKNMTDESADGFRAPFDKTSIGIGYHPLVREEGDTTSVIPTKPFQIPLGALIAETYTNVVAGGRTIGSTRLAQTAFRGPALEWTVGEAAGEVAVYCAGKKINAHDLARSTRHIRELQNWLVEKRGVPIFWYTDVTPFSPEFQDAQMAPFDNPDFNPRSAPRRYHN
jgi:hypothetical protein